MLDKSLPYYPVIMVKEDPARYPRYEIPAVYAICAYTPGRERDWAALETAAGQFDSQEACLACFAREFDAPPETLARRMFFARTEDGGIAGTASLWQGSIFGRERMRIHWVAVDPRHEGRGLAKALLTRVLDAYRDTGNPDGVYLTTQTWSWQAVGLYKRFGFLPYRDEKPVDWPKTAEEYERENALGWALIEERLAGREKPAPR